MLNRKSNFTLIELIVVIVVLGILAAIVIPNISSFSDEARDVQLTADARNMQTAVDMYRAKSDSGTADPVKGLITFEATHERLVKEGDDEYKVYKLPQVQEKDASGNLVKNADGTPKMIDDKQAFKLVDTDLLKDKHLRKLPKYVKNSEFFKKADGTDFTGALDAATVGAKVNFDKGQVIAGILQGADGKSTAIVKFVAPVDTDVAVNGVDTLAVIR